MCQHFDLFGDMLDALIEMAPVAAKVLDDSDQATLATPMQRPSLGTTAKVWNLYAEGGG